MPHHSSAYPRIRTLAVAPGLGRIVIGAWIALLAVAAPFSRAAINPAMESDLPRAATPMETADADEMTPTYDRSADTATENIYTAAKTSLLQVRTLLKATGGKSSLGSAFVVSADGFAVTNYHVVSQYVQQPDTYSINYIAPDGSNGDLKVVAVDIADDLAVVHIDRKGLPALRLDARALRNELPRGERLYAMGNPLDLGFTIVEGTYNGPLERSYTARLHFTGAINPGMSGGPAVTAKGAVAGVNVSKRLDGELVSFLVPAHFVANLLKTAQGKDAPDPETLRAEVNRQLVARERLLMDDLLKEGFKEVDGNGYRSPESAASWFTCWARTNMDQIPKPKVKIDSTSCNADTGLFIADELRTGTIDLTHATLHGLDINAFQFATQLSQRFGPDQMLAGAASKALTSQRCHDAFIAAPTDGNRPPLRAAWCARAYREFDQLYDISLVAVTQDRATDAAMVRLVLRGVSYDQGLTYGKQFLDALTWVAK
jgi:serine protease Do